MFWAPAAQGIIPGQRPTNPASGYCIRERTQSLTASPWGSFTTSLLACSQLLVPSFPRDINSFVYPSSTLDFLEAASIDFRPPRSRVFPSKAGYQKSSHCFCIPMDCHDRTEL